MTEHVPYWMPLAHPSRMIPPPWYANLWIEVLTTSFVILFISWHMEFYHSFRILYKSFRVLYKKWYNYEFGEQKSPFEIHRPEE
ncbi:hypothetical protein [Acidianus brierleyi]|uniref:hypothetical protein n=1 Tax=Acidianus brierleyi TaxID=41673 RepID=UPI0013A58F17|nr:hypothetical protein [Acidianus brierleyi]QIJ32865.1 hypothetical protein DFR85_15950 [Acidianus brierleyi]